MKMCYITLFATVFANCIGDSYTYSVEWVLIPQHRAEVLAQRHRSAKSLITLWLGLSCFYFSFLSTLNFSASAACIVIHCTPKARISCLKLRDQSLAESRCQTAFHKTGNWELLYLEGVLCKCYPALGSYCALHSDTRTFFLPTASLPFLPQATQQFPDQEMVAAVVGMRRHWGPLCQPFGPPESTWICLMFTMRALWFAGATLCLAICPRQPITLR